MSGTLGSSVSVAANTATTISFTTAGASLTITLDSAADVTLSAASAVSATMPTGYSSIGFSAQTGFKLDVSGSAKITQARLVTPPLAASAVAKITGSVNAGCVRFDADAEAYTNVAIQSYDAVLHKVTVDLPVEGTYFFAAVSANVPLPSLYAEARATSTTSAKFSYPGGFELDVSSSSSNEVTVSSASYSTTADPSGYTNLGAFWSIDLNKEESVTATLKFVYKDTVDISSTAAANLKFAFKNAAGAWEFPSSGGQVDASAGVMTQSTTHFSEWAAFKSDSNGGMSATNQAVNPASPSKCYALDYNQVAGSTLSFKLTKTEGSANLRMYLRKGTSCPSGTSHQMKSGLITNNDESQTLCLDSETTPPASDGRFMVAVYREGLSGSTSTTKFDLEVDTGFWCSPASMALPSLLLAFVAAFVAMAASGSGSAAFEMLS